MNKTNMLDNLYTKLEMYENLKLKIGYNEELLTKPSELSEELYQKKIVSKLPQITERRLFNNAYLKECIKQIKIKIEKIEAS